MAFQPGPGMPPPSMGGPHMGPMHTAGPMGQPPNQGMAPGMHPGMPGGPHVAQNAQMMGGMPPGMNPNTHAMQHLQPQGMFPNPGMAGAFPQGPQGQPTPGSQQQQAMMQVQQQTHNQQQLERQRSMMMAAMQAQQQQGGRPQNVNAGMMQAGLMAPQQMQNMPQNIRHFNLPSANGMQQQLRNASYIQAMQAQAQQAQQQQQQSQGTGATTPGAGGAGQGNGPGAGTPSTIGGPQGQPTPMRAQGSMQGIPPSHTPNPESAQRTPNPQHRPPPESMPGSQGPNEQGQNQRAGQANHSANVTRPPSSQPSQQNQPTPSTQPQASPAPSMQQAPNGRPQQNHMGQAQNQQGQQNPQGQLGGQQQAGQQQGQPQRTQEVARQHDEHMKRTLLAQQTINNINPMRGQGYGQMPQPIGMYRLMQFADRLSGLSGGPGNSSPDIDSLQKLISEFFSESAVYKITLPDSKTNVKETYEILQAALPRYFATQFASGVRNLSLITGGARLTEVPLGFGVECDHAVFVYSYNNNVQIKYEGSLKAIVGPNKIERMEFEHIHFEEYIPSSHIRAMFSETSPQAQTKSPKMMKTNAKQKNQGRGQPKTITLSETQIPNSPIRQNDGVTFEVRCFLENSDIFAHMSELLNFAHVQNHMSGNVALEQFAAQSTQNGPQMPAMNVPQGMAANPMVAGGQQFRNPFATNNPMGMNAAFNSPAHQALGLPNAANSPHLRAGGSPGMMGGIQHPMAAPMMPQQSGQGTNSSNAPSSNASPNVQGKKRRASAVKGDGDDGQPNGADANKLKATPKMGGKRQKGNP